MLIKLEWMGYRKVKKNYDHMLSRFHLIPECYRRTVGRTTDRQICYINMTRDKNSRVRRIHMSKPTVQQYEQCCQFANGNKTCCSLLLFRTIIWREFVRPKVHETWHHVYSNHLCLTRFFRITIFCHIRTWEQKVCGWGWKYAKFRHFLAHPVV